MHLRRPIRPSHRAAIVLALLACGCDSLQEQPATPEPTPEEAGVDGETSDAGVVDARLTPDGGERPDLAACDPQPVQDTEGRPTGLVSCGAGHYDRVFGVECPPDREGEFFVACRPQDAGSCRVDDDCGGGDNRCVYTAGECQCVNFCQVDSDCGAGEICVCQTFVPSTDPGGRRDLWTLSACQRTACAGEADCGGHGCGLHVSRDCGAGGFTCRTADDTCRTDSDCGAGEGCLYDLDAERWTCLRGGVACE